MSERAPTSETPSRMPESERQWSDAIQNAAKREASRLELPELGAHIAWVTQTIVGVTTTGISSLHRVGEPIGREPHTMCQEKIMPPAMWFPLSPAIIRTLPRCGYCEAGVVRVSHQDAA